MTKADCNCLWLVSVSLVLCHSLTPLGKWCRGKNFNFHSAFLPSIALLLVQGEPCMPYAPCLVPRGSLLSRLCCDSIKQMQGSLCFLLQVLSPFLWTIELNECKSQFGSHLLCLKPQLPPCHPCHLSSHALSALNSFFPPFLFAILTFINSFNTLSMSSRVNWIYLCSTFPFPLYRQSDAVIIIHLKQAQ